MEIRSLRANDDRLKFRSGDASLDRFFHQYAGQNQFRHHFGVTYVAVENGSVCGFATVAPRHISIEQLSPPLRKKLPRYPMPVLGLARLAVDSQATSQGVGSQLLRYVLEVALKMADEVGCAAVVVDSKPQAVGFYEKFGFRVFELLEGQPNTYPRTVPMYLMMTEIKACVARLH